MAHIRELESEMFVVVSSKLKREREREYTANLRKLVKQNKAYATK